MATAIESSNASSWQGLKGVNKDDGDGYVRAIGIKQQSQDLNNANATTNAQENNNSSNGTMQEEGGKTKVSPVQVPGVSLLAGKFLLVPEKRIEGAPQQNNDSMSCINIHTKEQFMCKIIPRAPKGLSMLAAYHRLEESSEFVNQVVEAILTPKVMYLIMPKNYGSVHSYLFQRRTLEEPEAANILKQMVQIVKHCHDKGVILRDVKMGRFVFMDKEKTKIRLDSLEDASLLVDPADDTLADKQGCPTYVSPEKVESLRAGLRYPGKSSDVWCLGIMLYAMLSGRYPFHDANQARLLSKIRAGNFVIPPGLSSSATNLIKALLRKSPSERPSCRDILKSPWITKHCRPSSPILPVEAETVVETDVEEMKVAAGETATTPIPIVPATCVRPRDQVVPNL